MDYDVFISYAREDRAAIARPLAQRLKSLGYEVWFDDFELVVGDSLRRSIDKGLWEAAFGVVILSPDYLRKAWPNRELDGLYSKDEGEYPRILPVWHHLSRKEILSYSPTLADKVAVTTEDGLDVVVAQIARAIDRSRHDVDKLQQLTEAEGREVELSRFRRDLIGAKEAVTLEKLSYIIDEFMTRYPSDPEARFLKERVMFAMQMERERNMPRRAPAEMMWGLSDNSMWLWGCIIPLLILIAIIAARLLFK